MRDERSGIGTGILLITIGLLFMADRQGYMGFNQMWPVILIVLGGVRLLFPGDSVVGAMAGRGGTVRRYRRRRGGGIWMILVGVLFLLNQNHWMSIHQSWPLFIVAGGLIIIFGGLGRRSPVIDTTEQGGGQ